MSERSVIYEIDEKYFTVKLYENLLQMDLKGSVRNEIEEALENKPLLKETVGRMLGIFAPLHVRLSNIDSVHVDNRGKVEIHVPHHRTIFIPLDQESAKRLVDKLNQLIPEAKEKELDRLIKQQKLERIAEKEQEMEGGSLVAPNISESVQPRGVLEKEKEAERRVEEKEEEQD